MRSLQPSNPDLSSCSRRRAATAPPGPPPTSSSLVRTWATRGRRPCSYTGHLLLLHLLLLLSLPGHPAVPELAAVLPLFGYCPLSGELACRRRRRLVVVGRRCWCCFWCWSSSRFASRWGGTFLEIVSTVDYLCPHLLLGGSWFTSDEWIDLQVCNQPCVDAGQAAAGRQAALS